MKAEKKDQPNPGIKCVVNSCYYYMTGDKCSAEKIEVQPRNAQSNEETDCATFTPDISMT